MPETATPPTTPPPSAEQLRVRVRDLERERRQLVTLVEILQDVAGTLNFVDILQTITQKLGETFGLDRCSIFLAERGGGTARLVASYEDPGIRNYVVDLTRYPELKRSLDSGEVVFIFLRTDRDGAAFSEQDVAFTEAVASLAAKSLRVVYRYERLMKRHAEQTELARRAERERTALIAYLRRLMEGAAERHGQQVDEELGRAVMDELDRLVDITMAVLAEEGKGR
jgi:hypothetical protein